MADDDDSTIEATHGPYKGQRLTMKKADADKAIADGWAKDPFKLPDEKQDKPERDETSDEDKADKHAKATEAAEKAANKLRGLDEHGKPIEQGKPVEHGDTEHDARKRAAETRDMKPDEGDDKKSTTAGQPGQYSTRQQTPDPAPKKK